LKAEGELGVNIIYCTGSRGTLAENLFADSQLQEEMRGGQVELEKYIITKTLTKPPEDYPDAKNQPHVKVTTHSSGPCLQFRHFDMWFRDHQVQISHILS
jgi:hypothetical protein